MNVTHWFGRWSCVLAVVAGTTAGCQSFESFMSKSEGISQKRKQRSQATSQQIDQTRDWADFQTAQARWQQGDLDGCAETLNRLLTRNPEHFEARLLMAESLLAADQPDEAIAFLQPAVVGHPDDARAHHLMGMLLDATGQQADALGFYAEAAALQPGNDVYQVSYQALADSDEPLAGAQAEPHGLPIPTPVPLPVEPEPSSLESFRAATEEGVGNDSRPAPPARLPEISPPRTDPPPQSGQPAPAPLPVLLAEESESSPQSGAPDSPRAPVRPEVSAEPGSEAGEFLVSDDEPLPDVEGTGRAGMAGPTGDPATMSAAGLLRKGQSALSDGLVALGFAYFREAMSLRPHDPQIPISAALCALRHGQPDLAVSLLEPNLDVFPDSAGVRRILATAHYRLGDYQSSQVALQQALSLDNSSGLSYFLMGCTLVKLGEPAAAETYFRQARRLDPRYPPSR